MDAVKHQKIAAVVDRHGAVGLLARADVDDAGERTQGDAAAVAEAHRFAGRSVPPLGLQNLHVQVGDFPHQVVDGVRLIGDLLIQPLVDSLGFVVEPPDVRGELLPLQNGDVPHSRAAGLVQDIVDAIEELA